MKAFAGIVAESDGRGGTRLSSLRSEAPLGLRATPVGVYLVGTAAGPVGGDELRLDIDVRADATLTIRSAAATLVFPAPARKIDVRSAVAASGPRLPTSVLEINVTVAAGASLRWLPEPVVAFRQCRHEMRSRVTVEAGGSLCWRDELILGRHGEAGGAVTSHMSLDVGGRAVLRQELRAGAHHAPWASSAVGGGARCVGSVVVVDPSWDGAPPAPAAMDGCAVLPLVGPAAQVTAVAASAATLRALLDWGRQILDSKPAETCKGLVMQPERSSHRPAMSGS